jgi:drug/metabolite transporter (DMT)-like permease
MFEFLKQPSTVGIVAGIISRFTSRTDIIFGKFLLKSISPMFVAFIEMLTGMILMLFYMGAKNIVARLRELETHELTALTISSILSGVLGPVFFLMGLNETSGVNTSMLINLNPLFMSIFAILLLREEFTKNLVFGIILTLFGIVILTTNGLANSIQLNSGDIYIAISAIGYSLGNVLFKKYVHSRHLDILVIYRTIVSSIILGGIMWFFFRPELLNFTQHVSEYYKLIILYAIVGIIITYILQYWSLENTSLVNNALIGLSSPIIGIVYSNIFLGEEITGIHIITVIMIISGMMLTKIDLIEKALLEMKIRMKQTHIG